MNFKDFKKVHDSEDVAILRNKKGHEFRIAKKGLKERPELLKELKSLRLYDGGDADKNQSTEDDADDSKDRFKSALEAYKNSGLNSNSTVEGEQARAYKSQTDEDIRNVMNLGGGKDAWKRVSDTAPEDTSPAPVMQNGPMSVQPPDGGMSDSSEEPVQQASSTPGNVQEVRDAIDDTYGGPSRAPGTAPSAPVQPAQQTSQLLQKENNDATNTVMQGQVHPSSYADLFAKKSTLGKIGTLFGLLVAGAGSGITGQPNAVLTMMGKELDNDMEAQKNSASNIQNLYKLNLQHQLQQAQIPQMLANGQLSLENAKLVRTHAQLNAMALTRMNARVLGFHALATAAQQTPPGSPQRQALAAMWPLIQNENMNIADQAAAAGESITSQIGPIGKVEPGSVDYNKFNELERASQMKIPGAPTPEDVSKMGEEAKRVGDANIMKKEFLSTFDKLDKMALAGNLSPNQRKGILDAFVARATKIGEGRFTEAANKAYHSLFPEGTDAPGGKTRAVKRQSGTELFGNMAGETPTLTRFGARTGGNDASPQAGARKFGNSNYKKVDGGWSKIK